MKLSSSNGTSFTISQLKQCNELLSDCFERINEINNGTFKKSENAVQFDYCTCPELSNEVDKINMIMKKITKVVYQE